MRSTTKGNALEGATLTCHHLSLLL